MDEIKFQNEIGKFKVPRTIFEISVTKNDPASLMMKRKRKLHTIANLLAYKVPEPVKKRLRTELVTEYEVQPAPKKQNVANVDSYKDPSFFIEMGSQENNAEGGDDNEEFLGVGSQGRFEKLIAGLDVNDLEDPLIKKQKMHRWDPKQGKYITSFLGDAYKAKGIRKNEAGKYIDPKSKTSGRWRRGSAYKRWQKDQNRVIQGIGNKEEIGEINNKNVNERGHSNLLALGLSKHKYGDPTLKEARQVKYKQILENDRIKRKRRLKDKRKKLEKYWMAKKKKQGKGKKGPGAGKRR